MDFGSILDGESGSDVRADGTGGGEQTGGVAGVAACRVDDSASLKAVGDNQRVFDLSSQLEAFGVARERLSRCGSLLEVTETRECEREKLFVVPFSADGDALLKTIAGLAPCRPTPPLPCRGCSRPVRALCSFLGG